jgi:ataxia telangiectasia mutated family protein
MVFWSFVLANSYTKSSNFQGEKTDYSSKIQELQKQLTLDSEEAQKIQVCMIFVQAYCL